mgnify:CR=1 FL=1
MRHLAIFILGLVTLTGCKSKQAAVETAADKSFSLKELTDSVTQYSAQPNNLSFKIAAQVKTPDKTNSFKVNTRLKTDSIIWLSVTAFGMEAARIQARPDSLFFVNKIEKTYYRGNYENAAKVFNLPVTFALLQNLLLANLPDLPKEKTHYYTLQNHYALANSPKRIAEKARLKPEKNKKDAQIIGALIHPVFFRPTEVNLLDNTKNLRAQITYNQFEEVEKNLIIPLKTNIFVHSKGKVSAEFKYSRLKPNTEKLSYPFKFYDHYEAIR